MRKKEDKHEVTIQGHKELVCWGVALYFQY